jgi:hypothetical protein
MIYSVYAVYWTEYERGWGQRPDGVSYHKDKESAIKYVSDYDKKFNNEPSAPDCYTKGGEPKLIEVDKKVYNEVMKKGVVWK